MLGDFDGDKLTDIAVFRESDGHWLLRLTATGALSEVQFGQPGDEAMAADFDGDGKDDLALWRAAAGVAFVCSSSHQSIQQLPWGQRRADEITVIGDYDGDGRAEPAIWRAAKAVWDVLFNKALR